MPVDVMSVWLGLSLYNSNASPHKSWKLLFSTSKLVSTISKQIWPCVHRGSIPEFLWKYCYSEEFHWNKRTSEKHELSLISVNLQYIFIEIALRQRCTNLIMNFQINISYLNTFLRVCFKKLFCKISSVKF